MSKWYQKTEIQVALIGGIITIAAAVFGFVRLSPKEKLRIDDVQVTSEGRGKYGLDIRVVNLGETEASINAAELVFLGFFGTQSAIDYDEKSTDPLDVCDRAVDEHFLRNLAVRIKPKEVGRIGLTLSCGWTDPRKGLALRLSLRTGSGPVRYRQHVEVHLSYLSDHEAELYQAIESANLVSATALLKNYPQLRRSISEIGILPRAAGEGRLEIVQLLVAEADTLSSDVLAESLRLAVENQRQNVIRVLLEKGALVSTLSPENPDCYRNRIVETEIVIRCGIIHNLASDRGISLLHAAAFSGNEEIVTILLRSGANPDIQDSEGRAPADYAMLRNHIAIAKLIGLGN
jgi:hypothetical protein